MPFLFDEKTFVNDNIQLFSERLESKYTRFLDKSPIYVTYYSIDTVSTTVDSGLQDVERVLGSNSPVRFNRILDLPIYMDNPVNVQTELADEGLAGSFDGEAVILPGTVSPSPNDYFVINHLGTDHAFVVDEFQLDTVKSNTYIRISFSIKDNTSETMESLNKQTEDEFHFVMANIGTESTPFILSSDIVMLKALEKAYADIITHYNRFFYDRKYNSYLFTHEQGFRIYDRFLTNFLNLHELLNEKRSYDTKFLSLEDETPSFYHQYEQTLYRALEDRDLSLMTQNEYALNGIESPASVFQFYKDRSIMSVAFNSPFPRGQYIPDDVLLQLEDKTATYDDFIWQLIHDYIHIGAEDMTIPVDKLSRHRHWMRYDTRTFALVPIVLYILRQRFSFFMKQ